MKVEKTQDFTEKRAIPVRCPILSCKCTKGKEGKIIGWDCPDTRAGPRKVGFPCKYNKVPIIFVDLE